MIDNTRSLLHIKVHAATYDIIVGIRNLKKCALLKGISVDKRGRKKDGNFCNRFFGKNH